MPRFTEEEAQRIFARAAEHQHAARDDAPGFSLDELEEIGAAAGLSPEHIARAVAEVRAAGAPTTEAAEVWGVPVSVRRSRHVQHPLSDEAWEGLVSALRKTFKTKGLITEVGRAREWTGTNRSGGLSNLHVSATPTDEGTRITLETSRAEEARQLPVVSVVLWLVPLFFLALGAATGKLHEAPAWVFFGLFAVFAAAVPLLSRAALARWSARRQREFDGLLDQYELAALHAARADPAVDRSAPSAPEAASAEPVGTPRSTPRLDIDGLTDAPDATARTGASRQRS